MPVLSIMRRPFDRVKHEKIVKILKSIGLDDKDLRVIVNLYWYQSAFVRLKGENTDAKILQGVRPGCILPRCYE